YAKITKDDLAYFDVAMDENVAAIMVGHPIVTGTLNSKGKQATVSKEIIEHLRQSFNGLIITDSINMRGLSWSYFFNKKRIYIDAVKAGNDIILDSNLYGCSSQGIQVCLKDLKKAVHEGEIPEKQIDESVKRILKAKGYEVVY
ncbi:MAG: glycoside hydrolase family 3 N-terminal domain-containing protein, partial [Nanoarchaeota archaeon]|nr:glycoside hydrolase family 3 N-terminal domain-containing protein [Nanoarchaeota archaeon]